MSLIHKALEKAEKSPADFSKESAISLETFLSGPKTPVLYPDSGTEEEPLWDKLESPGIPEFFRYAIFGLLVTGILAGFLWRGPMLLESLSKSVEKKFMTVFGENGSAVTPHEIKLPESRVNLNTDKNYSTAGMSSLDNSYLEPKVSGMRQVEFLPSYTLRAKPVLPAETVVDASLYALTGIISGGNDRIAVINNQLYRAGDQVDEKAVVARIQDQQVLLEINGGQSLTLRM
ncbi:MAG: hypothetical protein A2Z83_00865 [Omnitrophica bacterium GWA2_52_8]|nr:MAG: hypothetical protein A2Z83_00865 [Omnitrophica bacterium GWA2_52_8]